MTAVLKWVTSGLHGNLGPDGVNVKRRLQGLTVQTVSSNLHCQLLSENKRLGTLKEESNFPCYSDLLTVWGYIGSPLLMPHSREEDLRTSFTMILMFIHWQQN